MVMGKSEQKPWGDITGVRPVKQVRVMMEQGIPEKEIKSILKNEFKVTDKRIEIALKIAKYELSVVKGFDPKCVSMYIGIPFCPTRCVYCSFATNGADRTHQYIDEYLKYLVLEMEHQRTLSDRLGVKTESLYIGGGTPTTLSAEQLDFLLSRVEEIFDLSHLKEYTVEAGRPDTITEDKLKTIKAHGISRISINPQSMNQQTLDAIGRKHTVEDTYKAYEIANKVGFSVINSDIIAGLPGEDLGMFGYTLEEIMKLDPPNLTVHTLSIKRASRLKEELEEYNSAADSEVSRMVDMAYEKITESGREPYYLYKQKNQLGNLENIGYARMGSECLYNVYMMEDIQTVFSVGVGGVTKLVRGDRIERIFNFKDLMEYFKRHEELLKRKEYAVEFLG